MKIAVSSSLPGAQRGLLGSTAYWNRGLTLKSLSQTVTVIVAVTRARMIADARLIFHHFLSSLAWIHKLYLKA